MASSNNYKGIGVPCTAMLLGGFCASSSGIIMNLLYQHYGFSYDLGGLLVAMLSVGHLITSFLSGVLPSVIGRRASALIMSAGSALGFLMLCLFRQEALLILGFLIIGFGKGTTVNNCNVLAGERAENPTRGMNMVHACFATGSLLCPILIAGLSNRGIWYLPMAALSVCGLLVWVCFAAARLPGKTKKASGDRSDWSFLRSRTFWVLTILLVFQNATEISITGWIVTYFQNTGILSGTASQLTVTVVWGAILLARLYFSFLRPIKTPARALIYMSIGCLLTYALLLTSQNAASALIALALFGLCLAGINPTTVSCAGSGLSNAGMGIMLPIAGIGAIAMPYIIGAVASWGGIHTGMIAIVFAIAGMIVCAAIYARINRRKN